MNLVQIIYNTIQNFNLSDDEWSQLIAMRQKDEVQERAKRKLKRVKKEDIEMKEMRKYLTKEGGHFKSQNGKNLY